MEKVSRTDSWCQAMDAIVATAPAAHSQPTYSAASRSDASGHSGHDRRRSRARVSRGPMPASSAPAWIAAVEPSAAGRNGASMRRTPDASHSISQATRVSTRGTPRNTAAMVRTSRMLTGPETSFRTRQATARKYAIAGRAGTRPRSVPPNSKGPRLRSIHDAAMVAGSGVKPPPTTVTPMTAMEMISRSATPCTPAAASRKRRIRAARAVPAAGRGSPAAGTPAAPAVAVAADVAAAGAVTPAAAGTDEMRSGRAGSLRGDRPFARREEGPVRRVPRPGVRLRGLASLTSMPSLSSVGVHRPPWSGRIIWDETIAMRGCGPGDAAERPNRRNPCNATRYSGGGGGDAPSNQPRRSPWSTQQMGLKWQKWTYRKSLGPT